MDYYVAETVTLTQKCCIKKCICILNPQQCKEDLKKLYGTKIRVYDKQSGIIYSGKIAAIYTNVVGDSFLHGQVEIELNENN